MTASTLENTLTRFDAVIDARTSIIELIALFQSLRVSTKFEPAFKPWCFLRLIDVVATRAPDSKIPDILRAVEATGAGQAIQGAMPFDEYASGVGMLVRRYLAILPKTSQGLTEGFNRLAALHLTSTRIDAICALIEANESDAMVDLICDITADEAYHLSAARANFRSQIAI